MPPSEKAAPRRKKISQFNRGALICRTFVVITTLSRPDMMLDFAPRSGRACSSIKNPNFPYTKPKYFNCSSIKTQISSNKFGATDREPYRTHRFCRGYGVLPPVGDLPPVG